MHSIIQNLEVKIFLLALQPIVRFVFCSLLAGLYPPRVQGFLITHNDAPQSVGLLWTSDQSVAESG